MPLFTHRGSARAQTITGYSLVDEHMNVHGNLETAGTVRVDGHVEGHFHQATVLIVGATGVVAGDVHASEVVVAGHIDGSVVATGRVEIHATGVVRGDIVTAGMMLQEGGVIEGHVQVQGGESGAGTGSPKAALGVSGPMPAAVSDRGAAAVDAAAYATDLPRRAVAG
jgi:cytoskeletal protein CcmA (bactofilin family)